MNSEIIAVFLPSDELTRLPFLSLQDRLDSLIAAEKLRYDTPAVSEASEVFVRLIDWMASERNVSLSTVRISREVLDALEELNITVISCADVRSCKRFLRIFESYSDHDWSRAYFAYGPEQPGIEAEPFKVGSFLKAAASKVIEESYDALLILVFVSD